ncbi:MAG TPA: hypothetical protein VID27_13955, partial [Blastocatellia bacterium]
SVAGFVEPSGNQRWKFALTNGRRIPASARMTDGWLLFDAPLEGIADGRDLWRLLALNARLGSNAKFALVGQHTRLRAEIAIDDEIDAATRLTETCAALKEALSLAEGLRDDGPLSLSFTPGDNRASLPSLCGQAGWAFTERDGGRIAVNLEARNGFHQALLEESRGGVLISTEILRAQNLSQPSRQSLSALLLKASAELRMARAAVEEEEGLSSIRFEARFDSLPGSAEVDCALAALSLACALCARETGALENDSLARRYLGAGGFSKQT